MSQQQYPQPEQPGYGGPQNQPGYGGPQQGWGTPPPQPPKKPGAGKIIGFGCLGIVALFVVIGIIGAIIGGGDGKSDDKAGSGKGGAPAAAASEKAGTSKGGTSKDAEPAAKAAPVKITAKKAAFSKSILADGSDYTSVSITITNNGDEKLSVNPLYFSVTDTHGTKHTAELGVDDNQIDTVDLAPGENISGTVTGKGVFTAKYVTYTENLIGDPIRADVS
ncbi:DUF4352 domain-containing protein [Streptomyces sp. SAS_269]|uniref:DUF4352 domain-containing protein n=1 Tax=Streptomyces sp. SAS_269 TaxID=3412749 RepID=UPI00403C1D6C